MKVLLVYFWLLFCVFGEYDAAYQTTSNCPTLRIKNGRLRTKHRGRFVRFICNPGYILAGETRTRCIYGNWTLPPPKCVRPTCPNKVQAPANGLIMPSHQGAVLNFYCKPGFELRGSMVSYCDGKIWDSNLPSCFPNKKRPKLFCDFEEEDLCGWNHDLNHDFDWTREKFNTPSGSIGTGPSYDHTKGQGNGGYYMYIESSSRNENDTARLISPVFDKTDNYTCLEFYYHMYGATTGSLRAYLKKESDSWSLDPKSALFSKTGNQGDKWYRAFVSLGVIDEDFQIVIEGIRGPGYVSDIAIDDVNIIENCNYEENVDTTTDNFVTEVSEMLPEVESCQNRCGLKAFGNESKQIISCDCDDGCFENNRCCPDYIDFCVMVSTSSEFISTTDIPNEIFQPQGTSRITYGQVVSSSIAPMNPTSSTEPKKETAAPKTTSVVTVKKITTRVTTRPIIIINQPPTTPKIVEKILPKPIKPAPKNTSKIVYVKPKPNKPRKTIDNNDVIDLPVKKTDEELLPTSPQPDSFEKAIYDKEDYVDDLENRMDSPYLKDLGEGNKLLSEKQPAAGNKSFLTLILVSSGLIVVAVLCGLAYVRRYKLYKCRTRRTNADSQSDIRFLTGEEILDFSLARDYDEL